MGGLSDFLDDFSDPLGIVDFAKDQYASNRDYGHTREMFDSAQRFEERMSNTAYQRAVTDMEAAGLNPMLAYQQGGASSPSQGAPAINRASPTSGSMHTAAQVDQLRAQTDLAKAQADNVRVETEERRYNVANILPQSLRNAKTRNAVDVLEVELRGGTVEPEIAARRAEAGLREAGVPFELAKRQVELVLKILEVPGARFKARGYGMADQGLKGVKAFAEYAGDKAAALHNSAADAFRGAKHGYERFQSKQRFRRKFGEFGHGSEY